MTRKTVAMVMPRTGPTLLFAPYNYMALSTDLKARGYDPLILDCRLEDVKGRLLSADVRPNLAAVCFTSMMGPQLSYALDDSGWVREHIPEVPTIWGGILPTELPELCAEHPAISLVIKGWGEGKLPDVLDRYADGSSLEDVPGLIWQEPGGELKETEREPARDHPPLVYDWDAVDLNPFIMQGYGLGNRTLVMITTRGCPHKCTFCYGPQFHGSTWTGQTAEEVLADIDLLAKRYSFDSIFFNDDNFAVKWSRTVKIVEGCKARGLTYGLSFHASYLNEQRIGFLKNTGCVRLYWGPESGSNRMLKILKKDATAEMNLKIAEAAARHDLGALMGFMVGHPEETEADLQLTLNHIDELLAIHPGLDISDIKIFTPYPGTEFYDDALAHGFVPPKRLEDWASFYWNKANTPWLSHSEKKRLELISYTSLCAFATWRTEGLNPVQNRLTRILNKVERKRWDARHFDHAPELWLLQKYVDLHRLDGGAARQAWQKVRKMADRLNVR
ncbi:MAG: B12-binding domain-containing radical SAM protein [Proteobacteria bacterium]|nr:B12-binding domain-containing radical SAM protein [Pseudomonadota bacterium]